MIDFISGTTIRDPNKEEVVVQQLARWLVSIGYRKEQIQTHPQYKIPKNKHAIRRYYALDLVVFKDERHEDNNILLIAECKSPEIGEGMCQLRGYMRAVGAQVGIVFNGVDLTYVVDIENAFGETLTEPLLDETTSFGSYIRQRREYLVAKDITYSLRQVAQRVGITPTYLSKIELGQLPPPRDKFITQLAEVLGEDPHKLFGLAQRIAPEVSSALLLRPRILPAVVRAIKNDPDQVLTEFLAKRTVRDGDW